jgi:hypothetical protein
MRFFVEETLVVFEEWETSLRTLSLPETFEWWYVYVF